MRRAIKPLKLGKPKLTAQTASSERIKRLIEELVIDELRAIYNSSDDDSAKVDQLRALMEVVAIIHEGALPTIPRLVEPIELHSYLRQSSKGKIKINEKTRPLVFAAERLGMQIYPTSLAGLLQTLAARQRLTARARHFPDEIAKLAEATLGLASMQPMHESHAAEGAYVAIPAIDIHNPTRWPSLWHELGHHRLNHPRINLASEFENHVNGTDEKSSAFSNLCMKVFEQACANSGDDQSADSDAQKEAGLRIINAWLVECWCDAFGVSRAGLGFLYSQLHDFMFCWPNYLARAFVAGQLYPPARFRLRLSKNLAIERLKHRQGNQSEEKDSFIKRLIKTYNDEELQFLNIAASGNVAPDLPDLYNHFLAFFKSHDALQADENPDGHIPAGAFNRLEEDLASGLPIPAIDDFNNGASRPTHVSEIVLAGWMVRNQKTRAEVLRIFKELTSSDYASSTAVPNALDVIDRADEGMKRSIQVAEWFSILAKDASSITSTGQEFHANGDDVGIAPDQRSEPGLISDHEIRRLLFPPSVERPTLRIVPLINPEAQVKGTVVDVRLGHNFEIFHNVGQIAVDACNPDMDDRVDSLEREVDFLDGLPILPGQFVLGHTLEYIRLPSNIAAQIEGRSSFARLGIQVHMTANLVEAGFEGCLTLEILNSGPSTVVLYPGMRIAQLRFFRLAGKAESSYSRKGNKYHGQLGHNRTKQFSDPEVQIFRQIQKDSA